jgi:predicted O-linked N-acetylglucosamine transferase (SPINDLY family)
VTRRPDGPDPLLAQAMALHRAGRRTEAEPLYRRAAAAHPKDARYLYLLGLCLLEQGKQEEGAKVMADTVRIAPRHAGAHYALGRALAQAGEDAAAKIHLSQAVALAPSMAEHHLELGNLLARCEDLAGAVGAYRAGLRMQPRHPGLEANLGVALYRLGDRAEALALWRSALARNPDLAVARIGLANDLRNRGDLAGAERELRLAVAAEPRNPQARFSLGVTLRHRGDPTGAIVEMEKAKALDPRMVEAAIELARCYQSVCAWNAFEDLMPALKRAFAAALAGKPCAISPFFALSLPAAPEERAAVARRQAERAAARAAIEWKGAPPFVFGRPASERLTIGYLSSDLRDHPVGHLVAGLFGAHDRARVRVHAYSIGPDDASAYRRRFQAEADRFVDLSEAGNAEAARRIHRDEVDILVDLNGLTMLGRPEIAALRPAPVQATWLGFPGTTGASFFDYAIVDAVVLPPGHERFYAERACVLPHSYQANDRWPPTLGAATDRAAEGLPDGALVFCCFCVAYKIERAAFHRWMAILHRVPDSVLWLLAGAPAMQENLRNAASAAGIAPERILFAPRKPKPDHLARLKLADMMLDTFTYGGHTTVSDALAAGLPAVTQLGDDFASRVGASLLTAVGLPELIAPDPDAYEALAVQLGSDRAALDRVKAKLAAALPTAPLFDTPRLARNLERAYAEMARRWRAGEPARPIRVTEEG